MSTPGGQESAPPKNLWGKFRRLVERFLRDEDGENWIKEMRGGLSMTASIIATMTFQLATNPPGGVFQANGGVPKTVAKICRHDNTTQCPGEAVLGVVYQSTYTNFLICNTLSFISSLSVCLLLVSGIPLKHSIIIWGLLINMCMSITTLALSYLFAVSMVTPNGVWETANNMFVIGLFIWIGLLGIVSAFVIIRIIYRVGEWITKRQPAPKMRNVQLASQL